MNKNSVAKTLDKTLGVCIGLTISTLRYRHDQQIKKQCPRVTFGLAARSVAYRGAQGIYEGESKPLTALDGMHA